MDYTVRYDRTIYKNADDGFIIISVKTSDTTIPEKARSSYKHPDQLIRFVAVGQDMPETDAVEVVLAGDWETSKYGLQLRVETWDAVAPQTVQGIRAYLCCGLFKGVTDHTAALIVGQFGLKTLWVIENELDRLLEIPGISPDVLDALYSDQAKNRELQALGAFFEQFDVSKREAAKVYEFFGRGCMQTIKRSPYELCKVGGFGFKRVDGIARTLDGALNDPLRIKAAAVATLEQICVRSGHLYLGLDVLCKKALALLNRGIQAKTLRLSIGEVSAAIIDAAERKELILEDGCVYPPHHFWNELYVARRMASMLVAPSSGLDVRSALERAKNALSITPSELQEAAVVMAFQHKLSIMTGLPGTGKTMVLKLIIAVFEMLYPDGVIMLTAPTGRASRRMAESTGFEGARTMHSLMGIMSNNEDSSHLNSREPIEANFLIIDEFSMVDQWLAKELFVRLKPGTSLLLVGDAGQLPSVRPGNVFHDLIASQLVPVTALTQIFRQAEGSLIPHNAGLINMGVVKLCQGKDFIMEEFFSAEDTVDYLIECYLYEMGEVGVSNVQILSPYATQGIASAEKLNLLLRDLVNPAADGKAEVRVGKKLFRENDRIMQTKNKNNVSNGDIGVIRAIRDPRGTDTSVLLEFSGGRLVEYHPSELGIIELSYAITVHKAMGSEFEVVLMPVLSEHARLLDKRLLNTAITRGRLRDYLAGESHALINAIRNDKSSERNSRLGYQIKMQYAKLCAARRAPPGCGGEQLQKTG